MRVLQDLNYIEPTWMFLAPEVFSSMGERTFAKFKDTIGFK